MQKNSEAEQIDRWFENVSSNDQMLKQISTARQDEAFKEELKAIEQWFMVLNDSERTAALYALLQHINASQLNFFQNLLSQMHQPMPQRPGPIGSPVLRNMSPHHDKMPSIAPETPIKAPNRLFPDSDDLLQSPFLRPRTPLEEAIAAANWSSTPSSPPTRIQTVSPKLSRPASWVMDDSVMAELSSIKVSEPAKMSRMIRPTSPHRAQSPMYQNHHDHGRAPYKSPVLGHATPHGHTPSASPRIHSTNYYSGSPKLNHHVPGSPRMAKQNYPGSPKMGQVRSKSPFLNNAPNMSHLSTDHYSSEYSETESMDEGRYGKHREKGKIPEKIDLELCKDITNWLRSLRLHKYAPLFEKINYIDMVCFNDEQLEKIGVAALGARRKMLKVFEMVRAELDRLGIPHPHYEESPSAAALSAMSSIELNE